MHDDGGTGRPYRPAALSILTRLRRLAEAEVYRPVREADFSHLDFARYREIGRKLAAEGFRELSDVENVTVSEDPQSIYERTVIRGFLSSDGTVYAGTYQLRRLRGPALRSLWRGLQNLRWIAAPRFFLRTWATRQNLELSTDLADGHFVSTSNADAAGKLSKSPWIHAEFLPHGTPLEKLLPRHRARVAERLARSPGVRACVYASADDVMASVARCTEARIAHRRAIGLVTREEMHAIGTHAALADAIFDEIQAILREEAAAGGASSP